MFTNAKVYTIAPLFEKKQYKAIFLTHYKNLYEVTYQNVFISDCGKVFDSNAVIVDPPTT